MLLNDSADSVLHTAIPRHKEPPSPLPQLTENHIAGLGAFTWEFLLSQFPMLLGPTDTLEGAILHWILSILSVLCWVEVLWSPLSLCPHLRYRKKRTELPDFCWDYKENMRIDLSLQDLLRFASLRIFWLLRNSSSSFFFYRVLYLEKCLIFGQQKPLPVKTNCTNHTLQQVGDQACVLEHSRRLSEGKK